jgi:hypothetical protein
LAERGLAEIFGEDMKPVSQGDFQHKNQKLKKVSP